LRFGGLTITHAIARRGASVDDRPARARVMMPPCATPSSRRSPEGPSVKRDDG
jgi:hypothetical protein